MAFSSLVVAQVQKVDKRLKSPYKLGKSEQVVWRPLNRASAPAWPALHSQKCKQTLREGEDPSVLGKGIPRLRCSNY